MEHFLSLDALSPHFVNKSFQFADCPSFTGSSSGKSGSTGSFCPSSGRKFVVFDEEDKKGGKDCDGAGSVSTLTFLNFVIGSLSLAASVVSNTNSNSNNNNNNNNDNNNNDNNINIGNSNNNVNSQNQLMFLPMVGRSIKPTRKSRSVFWTKRRQLCREHRQGKSWLAKCAIRAIEFFVRLESCRLNKKARKLLVEDCLKSEICQEQKFLSNISDVSELLVLSHLTEGTAKIVGVEFEEVNCKF